MATRTSQPAAHPHPQPHRVVMVIEAGDLERFLINCGVDSLVLSRACVLYGTTHETEPGQVSVTVNAGGTCPIDVSHAALGTQVSRLMNRTA